jgi:hypothetical protein
MWVIADLIVWGLTLLYILLTGGIIDTFTELLIGLVLGLIPFPFNLIVIWQIDPVSIILQSIIFIVLVVAFLFKNRD